MPDIDECPQYRGCITLHHVAFSRKTSSKNDINDIKDALFSSMSGTPTIIQSKDNSRYDRYDLFSSISDKVLSETINVRYDNDYIANYFCTTPASKNFYNHIRNSVAIFKVVDSLTFIGDHVIVYILRIEFGASDLECLSERLSVAHRLMCKAHDDGLTPAWSNILKQREFGQIRTSPIYSIHLIWHHTPSGALSMDTLLEQRSALCGELLVDTASKGYFFQSDSVSQTAYGYSGTVMQIFSLKDYYRSIVLLAAVQVSLSCYHDICVRIARISADRPNFQYLNDIKSLTIKRADVDRIRQDSYMVAFFSKPVLMTFRRIDENIVSGLYRCWDADRFSEIILDGIDFLNTQSSIIEKQIAYIQSKNRILLEKIIVGLGSIFTLSEFVFKNSLLSLSEHEISMLNIASIVLGFLFLWWTNNSDRRDHP